MIDNFGQSKGKKQKQEMTIQRSYFSYHVSSEIYEKVNQNDVLHDLIMMYNMNLVNHVVLLA